MTPRPSWSDLTPAQRLNFGNGIGPGWLPAWARRFITRSMSWFFQEASWRHHDFGYAVGRTERERWRYDWLFFRAMLRDAVSQRMPKGVIAVPVAVVVSLVFYLAVMAGGWISFEYGARYRTVEEALNDYRRQSARR